MKLWQLKRAGVLLLILAVYFYMGNFLERSNFPFLIAGISALFVGYIFLYKQSKAWHWKQILLIGVLFRLAFLIAIPNLSDDYFRFIWDGHLVVNGVNPYNYLPTEVAIEFPNKGELLAGMNSPNYYSVYPPFTQAIYAFGVWLSHNSILGNIIVLRLFIIASECISFLLIRAILKKNNLHLKNATLYFFNPLCIIEFVGGLHFEAFVILFLSLSIWLIQKNKVIFSAISWSIAIGLKLIPLLLVAAFIRKLKLKKALLFYFTIAASSLLLFFPLLNLESLLNFKSSIDLYFKTFEFNASFYYLIRELGISILGYNPIQTVGPILSKIAIGIMLFLQLRKKKLLGQSYFEVMLFSLLAYYLFASIVHPWYVGLLVFFSVFTSYRFAILWSFLAFLSYNAYTNADYRESHILIAIEYISLLSLLIYELVQKKQSFAILKNRK
jgi:hypothetical protein